MQLAGQPLDLREHRLLLAVIGRVLQLSLLAGVAVEECVGPAFAHYLEESLIKKILPAPSTSL